MAYAFPSTSLWSPTSPPLRRLFLCALPRRGVPLTAHEPRYHPRNCAHYQLGPLWCLTHRRVAQLCEPAWTAVLFTETCRTEPP